MTNTRTYSTNRTDPNQGAYNGFSLAERMSTSNVTDANKHLRPRFPPKGWACASCGLDHGSLYWHAEDYRMPLDQFPMCPWCHWALHQRYKNPTFFNKWKRLVNEGWQPLPHTGEKWHVFKAKYLDKAPDYWDGAYHGGPLEHCLLNTLPMEYSMVVPAAFAVADGAPHHPYQWKSKTAIRVLMKS